MASNSRRSSYKSCLQDVKSSCRNSVNVNCKKKSCSDNTSDNCICCCKRKNKSSTTSCEALVYGCNGVKPLATFYDSIPDYCDIYHLPKDEFDSTLDDLRATCNILSTTDFSPTSSALEFCSIDDKSTSSSSLMHQHKEKKAKKSSKKKIKKIKVRHPDTQALEPLCVSTPCTFEKQDYLFDKNRFKSFKEDCEREVEAFRQSLKEFEKDLKRPIYSPCPLKNIHSPSKANEETQTDPVFAKFADVTSNHKQKPTLEKDRKSENLCETMKKSLSLNDIHKTSFDNFEVEKTRQLLARLSRINDLDVEDIPKASNFLTAKNEHIQNDKQEPLTKSHESPCQFKKLLKKKRRSKSEENFKIPFSPFSHSNYRLGGFQASPIHPVARPNLAATLRAEVCKQKLREQRTNCTFYDGTKHFDWEVRKTPAWKSLSMQETHDQSLMLRLAARKAEQALQQRQYEMNLELMRQRVKSAPLLLEGETQLGINVGKLTHNCHVIDSQQTCHSNRSRGQHMHKKNSYLNLCPHHKTELCLSQEMFKRANAESRSSYKIHKIYANNSKLLCSKYLQKSESSCGKKHKSREKVQTQKQYKHNSNINIESGDDLSSVDRAYL